MDVIDLTDSFTLADHCDIADIVIDLANDESCCLFTEDEIESVTKLNNETSTKEVAKKPSSGQNKTQKKECNRLGDCPICWEELGINCLASTKCGHVYCLKCLEKALQVEKKCPTCRRSLKGNSAYHPLYVGRQ